MPRRDVVVIGASATAVSALPALLAALPPTTPAAVLVAVGATLRSGPRLDAALSAFSSIPVRCAEDGDPIVAGRVLVAPPDHRLLAGPGHVEVTRASHDEAPRKAIDHLLDSSAKAFGSRVCAVVLSSDVDDANAMSAVSAFGGACTLQDPARLLLPDMASSAARRETCGALQVELLARWIWSEVLEELPDDEESRRRMRLRGALEVTITEQERLAKTAGDLGACTGLAGEPFAQHRFRSRAHASSGRARLLWRRVVELA